METAIELVRNRFLEYGDSEAIFWHGQTISYNALYDMVDVWHRRLEALNIKSGDICGILGAFPPSVAALFFALMEKRCILVPLTKSLKGIDEFVEIAQIGHMFTFSLDDDSYVHDNLHRTVNNDLLKKQVALQRSGLIVFSSGSTGKPKGILQDCERVMNKLVQPRKPWRTL